MLLVKLFDSELQGLKWFGSAIFSRTSSGQGVLKCLQILLEHEGWIQQDTCPQFDLEPDKYLAYFKACMAIPSVKLRAWVEQTREPFAENTSLSDFKHGTILVVQRCYADQALADIKTKLLEQGATETSIQLSGLAHLQQLDGKCDSTKPVEFRAGDTPVVDNARGDVKSDGKTHQVFVFSHSQH